MILIRRIRHVIAIGDRDGIPGPAIEDCAEVQEQRSYLLQQNVSFEQPQVLWIWRSNKELKIQLKN